MSAQGRFRPSDDLSKLPDFRPESARAQFLQTVRKLDGVDGGDDRACGSALFSRFGLKSRRWPLGRHGRTATGGYAAKQRDLGLCQAATAAIILSMPRMLSTRRKLCPDPNAA